MHEKYTPRRANRTRWLDGAPDYVLDVFDSRDSGERYTVLFTDPLTYHVRADGICEAGSDQLHNTYVQFLGMDDAPSHPQGISMWGELKAYEAVAYRERVRRRDRIRWTDLPAHIQAHVRMRVESD